MNHIEEMMETAGVTLIENNCQDCPYNMEECRAYYCADFKYPDFTAEKQLELIKLIGLQGNVCIAKRHYGNCNWMITTHHKNGAGDNQDFTEALAQLTTELMNAGELDKEKVKEILQC